MLESDLARPDAFGPDPRCPGCYDTTQSDVDPTGAVGNTRRARDAIEREAGRVGLSMRRATDEARGYYYPRLYGCRGVSCFGLHAGAFATELFAGVAPQSRDDVLLDATLTLTTSGLGKAGRSADDLRDLARQFHRDESGAVKILPGGSVPRPREGHTRLWRAVEPAELDDIRRVGDYDIHPNSTFKRFALDEESVDAFMRANPDREYTKTFVDVPTDYLDQMYRHPDPGGVGESIGIDVYENPGFYDRFEDVNIVE